MFFITGYPRSRTAWFAGFFTTGPVFCHHEIKLIEPGSRIEGFSGPNFALTPQQGKMVIIERDEQEVRESLRKLTKEADAIIDRFDLKKLDGLRVKFEDINDRLQEIWEYCVDIPFDVQRAELFKNLKIEQNYGYLRF